jgi:hypothetical protein
MAGVKCGIENAMTTAIEILGRYEFKKSFFQISGVKNKRYSVSLDFQKSIFPEFKVGLQIQANEKRKVMAKIGWHGRIGKCELQSVVTVGGGGKKSLFVVASRLETKISERMGLEVGLAIDHTTSNCSIGLGLTFLQSFLTKTE